MRLRGEEDVSACVIMLRSSAIGYIQFYLVGEESRNSYGLPADYDLESVYGIDQFIGEVSCWNGGLGTRSISLLLRYLFQTNGARKVILDPQVTNLRAIRRYEKCGFRKVKILEAHETHEGVLRDALLMEASAFTTEDTGSTEEGFLDSEFAGRTFPSEKLSWTCAQGFLSGGLVFYH